VYACYSGNVLFFWRGNKMALFEDIFKGVSGLDGGVTGIAAAIGAAVLAPVVIPAVAGVAKPAAKAAIKEGIWLSEKSKEFFAEATEVFEDLVAEAKAELAQDGKANSQPDRDQPEVIVVSD
jgi:hypothetical protein